MCERCNGGYDREKRMEAMRATREAKFEYVAVYGAKGTTVSAATFPEVAEKLIAKGYLMATAKRLRENAILVDHKDKDRKPAAIEKVLRVGETL